MDFKQTQNTDTDVGNKMREVKMSNSYKVIVRIMVFNVTFNNISVISWRSVVLMEEARVPGENHVPTCLKSLTNFITYIVSITSRHERD